MKVLPPVSSILGLYAADCLELLLPEAGAEQGRARAASLVARLADVGAAVSLGVYPFDATSAGSLLARCRGAVQAAHPGLHALADGTAETAAVATQTPAVDQAAPAPGRWLAAVLAEADRVADSTINVLILGDTGSAKEVLARRIHRRSPRARRPFHAVNCGALPPTLVESTLFGHERGAFTGADARRVGLMFACLCYEFMFEHFGDRIKGWHGHLMKDNDDAISAAIKGGKSKTQAILESVTGKQFWRPWADKNGYEMVVKWVVHVPGPRKTRMYKFKVVFVPKKAGK